MTRPTRTVCPGPDPDADGVVRAEFDWGTVSPSVAVVEAVAVASDREPTAVEPLVETVDPDALNALVAAGGETCSTVTFEFIGHDVAVQSNGVVLVGPPTTGQTEVGGADTT